MLKDKIAADLKTAMLAGDKTRVDALKMIKSALLYKEVELGLREAGLSDEQAIAVLTKEAKSRQDAAKMYKEAGDNNKAAAETAEFELISEYLPEQISDKDLELVVENTIKNAGEVTIKDMGRIIGIVKKEVGASADGGRIALVVKQRLS